MKWTALLAVAAFLVVAGPATAAPKAVKGVVVAKRAHGTIVVATGWKGLAVTVAKVTSGRARLGERVSVVGTRVHVLSRVKTARIRGLVVKRTAHALRVASGRSMLTVHTSGRALASHGDDHEGDLGEFEVEFEHGDLFEHRFTPASQTGTVEIEGALVTVSPLVVSIENLPVEITVPSGVTLPALTPGQRVELTVQTGSGNTFTLVSIEQARNNDEEEVEAKGVVTRAPRRRRSRSTRAARRWPSRLRPAYDAAHCRDRH